MCLNELLIIIIFVRSETLQFALRAIVYQGKQL